MNILVTGCGSGLGAALSSSQKVFCHYRTGGNELEDLCGDITEWSFSHKLETYLRENDIDVFINSAAQYLGGPFKDTSDEEIDRIITVNLTSQIKMIKRVYNYFLEKQKGMIININSHAGLFPSSQETIYCASKFGLKGFSKSLQIEAVGTGIEILDVYPGAMQTRMTKDRGNYNSLMKVEEVADQILDLINNKSYYINEIVLRRRNESSNS